MVTLINKQLEERRRKIEHNKLVNVINSEIEKIGIITRDWIDALNNSQIMLYKPAKRMLGYIFARKIMKISTSDFSFEVELMNNNHLLLARDIASRLEKEYNKEAIVRYKGMISYDENLLVNKI